MKTNKPTLAIHLFHGRTNPDQDLNDWGLNGPTLGPFHSFYVTYLSTFRIITGEEEAGEFSVIDGMIYYDGVYYGDWTISTVDIFEGEGKKIEIFNEIKAMTKEEYLQKVKIYLENNYGLGLTEMEGCLEEGFKNCETPEALVEWYAEKYDLTKLER
jgi:hypothetical protein